MCCCHPHKRIAKTDCYLLKHLKRVVLQRFKKKKKRRLQQQQKCNKTIPGSTGIVEKKVQIHFRAVQIWLTRESVVFRLLLFNFLYHCADPTLRREEGLHSARALVFLLHHPVYNRLFLTQIMTLFLKLPTYGNVISKISLFSFFLPQTTAPLSPVQTPHMKHVRKSHFCSFYDM